MKELTDAERELVSLGAALASNCVPCIEHHVPEARKAGLTDAQIHEAILVADKVRQVPARKVLATATSLVRKSEAPLPSQESACGQPVASPATSQPCCDES